MTHGADGIEGLRQRRQVLGNGLLMILAARNGRELPLPPWAVSLFPTQAFVPMMDMSTSQSFGGPDSGQVSYSIAAGAPQNRSRRLASHQQVLEEDSRNGLPG